MDYPITDVLQMMGRAGRPQYDRHGVAVIMVGCALGRLAGLAELVGGRACGVAGTVWLA